MTRVAVIAGVGPTIGAAVARRFHDDGFAVALLARSEEYVRTLAADLGGDAVAIPTDVTDDAAVEAALERVRDELGPAEVLVLNASGGGGNPVDDASADRLRELFDVRVAGSMACVRAALPDLRETEGTVLFSGTTFAEPPVTAQVEWGAVAPAARGLALSLDAALDDVSVTYVRIGSPVRPDAGPTAIDATALAAEYRRLVDHEGIAMREIDVRKR
ncbi:MULTISPECIES: SDR family oxidoreductase [Halorubrum]|uniref:SDR family NAD(P)-dependent oxidoreductase n=1 Tax=Halorubrum ezzemoulense TaxID=337243 RepID=A0A256K7S7_HALEZ|nr:MULTISPECIES: SDR family NAD(P)-dependent oxidoreductase [Halorubrum]OYR76507.1 short-chain dehydrogenase [Halorubrum ezzemoulense]OYR81195.1 short-chain dehydrogenase [Halorubrum ezzemoulense]PHQ43467.1 short-chain dehydrogenase [Halorubrum sp. C191]QAY19411.1 SDR family NAD(P)-dependent oxidoreductase [Halorubrum ezzemoulense]